jgi:anti-sigma factor RsiW
MNVSFGSHFSQNEVERYVLGMLSEHPCSDVEEHLLTCPRCQTQLEGADEYINVVRAAYVFISSRSQSVPGPLAMQLGGSL